MTDAQGFPAFPARSRRRQPTWWGTAWIQAMEDTAVDAGLTKAGRRIAGQGQIGPITISPGRIAAVLDNAFSTSIAVEALSDNAWAALVAEASLQSGHLAALLDGFLPHDLSAVVPGVGDLDAQCNCDDWGNPCQHAAALCYQAAWLLDADPSLLFLLRGRSAESLTKEVSRHHNDNTVLAAEAFARPAPSLPEPPPPATGELRLLSIEPPPGMDAGALAGAAATAATRARQLLAEGPARVADS
ncbi:SWIM zinc finger family protein [Kutzneria sp. 744]|uniref:SWIM zinc finger family protein n=1 Tax=Kutzneria sp. (strain 744) TaxID=345341 RepID=UPI0003EEDC63|nr:SWIM zinc finger family protein [Kutzneria sp. 744]EWM14136.1 SWIM zinc finger protein [Kutzneria sp. 744]